MGDSSIADTVQAVVVKTFSMIDTYLGWCDNITDPKIALVLLPICITMQHLILYFKMVHGRRPEEIKKAKSDLNNITIGSVIAAIVVVGGVAGSRSGVWVYGLILYYLVMIGEVLYLIGIGIMKLFCKAQN